MVASATSVVRKILMKQTLARGMSRLQLIRICLLVLITVGICTHVRGMTQNPDSVIVPKYSCQQLIRLSFDSLIVSPQFAAMLESTCVCDNWSDISDHLDVRGEFLASRSGWVQRSDTGVIPIDGRHTMLIISDRIAALIILANTLSTAVPTAAGWRVDPSKLHYEFFSQPSSTNADVYQTEPVDSTTVRRQPCHIIGKYYYTPVGYLHAFVYVLVRRLMNAYAIASTEEKGCIKECMRQVVTAMFAQSK